VVDAMGKSLATQHLSHDDKGLCILKPGSVSSVLLNRIRSLAMQYEDSEERNHSLCTRSFTTFCKWLAEMLAALVLYDLRSMSFETYMARAQFPHANAKTFGVEPIY
jgi:hypothetical protein